MNTVIHHLHGISELRSTATPEGILTAQLTTLGNGQGKGRGREMWMLRGRSASSARAALATFALTLLCAVITPSLAAAAGDANNASCGVFGPIEESPGFKTYLPDCRGLELVSPPYQGGQPLSRSQEVELPISSDGQHIIGIDFAGFANTGNLEESSDFGAPYEMSRGSGGWSPEALAPPSSMAARSNFIAASADLSKSLWTLSDEAEPGEELSHVRGFTVYVREGQGNSTHWTAIGPGQPEPLPFDEHGNLQFSGASADLGVVVFTPDTHEPKYWPGDPTPGLPSLYQYRGTGNTEPELVGISNAGALSGTPKNEGAVLESECGTSLGSTKNGSEFLPEGSAYNAVSASGNTIFFSALHTECGLSEPPATEIFARIDGGLSSAHTVAISEPSSTDCASCDTSTPAEATYEGASRDGTKVFFLTTQALLPGASGQSLYEYDFTEPEGQRVKLVASDVPGVARISENGDQVYFVSSDSLTATADGSLASGHESPVPGEPNLYAYDTVTHDYSFVAPLAEADGELWLREDKRPIQTTEDGSFAVFRSTVPLTADDESSEPQLFEYDASTHSIKRISIGQTGSYLCSTDSALEAFGCNGNQDSSSGPLLPLPFFATGSRPPNSRVAIAADGSVAFTSPDALTPGAVNDRVFKTTAGEGFDENIYEYSQGNVYLISAGDEEAPLQSTEPRLIGTSTSGADIFFTSTTKLTPQDVDTQASWYDARVGGGLPSVPGPVACGEGTCQQPPPAAPPAATSAGTELSSGEAMPSPAGSAPPKPKPISRATKLKRALKKCAAIRKRSRRQACVKLANHNFGPLKKKKEPMHSAKGSAHR